MAQLPEWSLKKITDYLIFCFRDVRKETRKNVEKKKKRAYPSCINNQFYFTSQIQISLKNGIFFPQRIVE